MNWNCVAPAYTVVSHCAGLASTTPHTRLRVRFIKERPLAFSARPANLTSARCSYIRTHLTAFWLDFITTTLQLEASKETNGSLIIVIIPGHQQIHTMLLALSWLHHKQVPNTGIIKPYAVMFLTLTVNTTVITPDHTPSAQSGPYITLPHCTHIRCRLLPRYIQQFITTHAQEPSHKKKTPNLITEWQKLQHLCTQLFRWIQGFSLAGWTGRAQNPNGISLQRRMFWTLRRNEVLGLFAMVP